MSDELPIAIWRSQDSAAGIESEQERNFVDIIYTLVVIRRRQPAFHRYSRNRSPTASPGKMPRWHGNPLAYFQDQTKMVALG